MRLRPGNSFHSDDHTASTATGAVVPPSPPTRRAGPGRTIDSPLVEPDADDTDGLGGATGRWLSGQVPGEGPPDTWDGQRTRRGGEGALVRSEACGGNKEARVPGSRRAEPLRHARQVVTSEREENKEHVVERSDRSVAFSGGV